MDEARPADCAHGPCPWVFLSLLSSSLSGALWRRVLRPPQSSVASMLLCISDVWPEHGSDKQGPNPGLPTYSVSAAVFTGQLSSAFLTFLLG